MFRNPQNDFNTVKPLTIPLEDIIIITRVLMSKPILPLFSRASLGFSTSLLVQNILIQSQNKQERLSKCDRPFLDSTSCTNLTFDEHSGHLLIKSIISWKILASISK